MYSSEEFIKAHEGSRNCPTWHADLVEAGTCSAESSINRMYCDTECMEYGLSEEQVWRVLRYKELDWCLLRCLIVTQEFSKEQLAHALKFAGEDWRLLKHLIRFHDLTGPQWDAIIDLSDRKWQWIEGAAGVERFSKKHIDKIVATVNADDESELREFISSVGDIKTSEGVEEAALRTLNTGCDRKDFKFRIGIVETCAGKGYGRDFRS